MYCPQFACSTPRGFRDETFHYSFDGTNVAALGAAIPAGQAVNNITLQLQQDAEFVLRGIKVQLGTAPSDLQIHFRDPFSNFLSHSVIPLATYLTGGGLAVVGRMVVPFMEPEIVCPIGGFFQVNLMNPTTGAVLPPAITLFGVKRYRECAA